MLHLWPATHSTTATTRCCPASGPQHLPLHGRHAVRRKLALEGAQQGAGGLRDPAAGAGQRVDLIPHCTAGARQQHKQTASAANRLCPLCHCSQFVVVYANGMSAATSAGPAARERQIQVARLHRGATNSCCCCSRSRPAPHALHPPESSSWFQATANLSSPPIWCPSRVVWAKA